MKLKLSVKSLELLHSVSGLGDGYVVNNTARGVQASFSHKIRLAQTACETRPVSHLRRICINLPCSDSLWSPG
jgi:hypothetical protein